MTLGIAFWVIYIVALVFGGWSNYTPADPAWRFRAGAYFVLWLLVGVLGWAQFGAPIHR